MSTYRPYDYRFRDKVSSSFYNNFVSFKGFVEVTEEAKDAINERVQKFLLMNPIPDFYKDKYKDDIYYKALGYIYGNSRYHNFKTYDEKALFLLLAVDPSLQILDIYEDESNIKVIKDRVREAIGVFDERFLLIARCYKKRFCPDKEFGTWTLKKGQD